MRERSRERGAEFERRVARRVGGVRTGNSGRATIDVSTPWLAIECKYRRSLPQWIKHAHAQASGGAGEDRLPIVILGEFGVNIRDAFVLIRFADFESWFIGGKNDTN